MIQHGIAPFYECSSSGDKRFSAFYARLRSFGNRSIEEIYQAAKIFEDGSTNLNWKQAKGRKPINAINCRILYAFLWRQYITENPELVEILQQQTGLSDIYGEENHCCQATELWEIRAAAIAVGLHS